MQLFCEKVNSRYKYSKNIVINSAYCCFVEFEILSALVVFAFVSSVTPGPNNLMLMASGTNYGIFRTIPHMLGVGIGFTVMVLLVGVGLMQMFEAVPGSFQMLRVISIVYLGWLAWRIAMAVPAMDADVEGAGGKPFTFIQAALFQWVNPKAWTMALTAIGAYTPPGQPFASVFLVALVFGLVNLPCVSVWVIIGTRIRRFLRDATRLRLFNWFMAALLLASLAPVLRN